MIRKSGILGLLASLLTASSFAAEPFVLFDFTNAQQHGWVGNPRIASITPGPEGLHVVCSGEEDPWIEGPPCDKMPEGEYDKLLLELTFATRGATAIEVFYGQRFVAGDSARIPARGDGQWQTASTIIPRLKPGDRLRIDPAQDAGEITLAGIKITPMIPLFNTVFTAPKNPDPGAAWTALRAGDLTMRHNPLCWDDFVIERKSTRLASGHSDSSIIYLTKDGRPTALPLKQLQLTWQQQDKELRCSARHTDPDGRVWTIRRVFQAKDANAIAIHTSISLSAPAEMVNLPWLTLFPGLGSFGSAKDQALFAGVEYLMNEPSSDTKDVQGPNAQRQLVANHKICFPLMALLQQGQWLALSWNEADKPAPVFDSPDRIFNSGAHLFALWTPGVSQGRIENDFNVYQTMPWNKDQDYQMSQLISAGDGENVLAAVKDYLRRQPLPPLPEFAGGYQAAIELLAAGWLDSAAYVDGQWRHAVVPTNNFAPQDAADALVLLAWLSRESSNPELSARIDQRLADIIPHYRDKGYFSGVSHGRNALFTHLYFNQAETWLNSAAGSAASALATLRPDGSIPFVAAAPPKPDYGTTHWTDHANGLTANRLGICADYALAAGDTAFRRAFIDAVDRVLTLYRHDAPRGAQTWEIPLHTPDILGSAYMLKLCVAAYRLNGQDKYLREAEYWALSGVPFIYLIDPVLEHGPVGRYGTIAVLGATNWKAPYWIGLPVQWCGMVFRNQLLNYASEMPDPEKRQFWKQLADGITITGLQMTHPKNDEKLQGLLPDFFPLNSQKGAGPAINPGTVLHGFPQAYGKNAIFTTKAIRPGMVVHALGEITPASTSDGQTSIDLALWPKEASDVLISGLTKQPTEVRWKNQPVEHQWSEKHQVLILRLAGNGRLSWR